MANPEGKFFPGQWLFYCDVCGKKMLSAEAYHRWDGMKVCKNDWEIRHPQDFLRARRETSNQLPWARPRLPEISVGPAYVDQYVQFTDGLMGTDNAYQNTGIFYWYDTSNDGAHSLNGAPEAYVTGDYY